MNQILIHQIHHAIAELEDIQANLKTQDSLNACNSPLLKMEIKRLNRVISQIRQAMLELDSNKFFAMTNTSKESMEEMVARIARRVSLENPNPGSDPHPY